MIREQIVYVCVCSKCEHKWTTKTKDIPLRCSKCNRITWNDDYAFDLPQEAPEPIDPTPAAQPARKSLAELQAMIDGIGVTPTIAAEPAFDPWQDIGPHWNEIQGEMVEMQKHYKTGAFRPKPKE